MGALRRTQKQTNMAIARTMTSMMSIPTMVRAPMSSSVSTSSLGETVLVGAVLADVVVVVGDDDNGAGVFVRGDDEGEI